MLKTSTISCKIIDAETGKKMPARISIFNSKGNCFAPESNMIYGYATPDEWPSDWGVKGIKKYFYANGRFSISLAPGEYNIVISRGYEYIPATTALKLESGESYKQTFELERIVDMPSLGWHCCDNHTHFDHHPLHYNLTQKQGLFLAAAEGLHAVCFLRNKTRKPTTYHSPEWNCSAHFGYEMGHHPVLNSVTKPPQNLTCSILHDKEWFSLSEWVRAQGGTIIMGHPLFANHLYSGLLANDKQAAHMMHYEIPVNAALKKVDAFELQNNRYSIISTWLQIWYRLQNCGIQLPLSAGTDACASVKSSLPLGIYRLYVKTAKNEISPYLKGLQKGQSFITDGPLLFLTVNGKGPGESISFTGQTMTVTVSTSLLSVFPCEKLELIQNGSVKKIWNVNSKTSFKVQTTLSIKKSSWLALRVYRKRIKTEKENITELFAHTNPVYIKRKGEPIQSSEDALFFLQWTEHILKLRLSAESAKKATRKAQRKFLPQLTSTDKKKWLLLKDQISSISLDDFSYSTIYSSNTPIKINKTPASQYDICVKVQEVELASNAYYRLSATVKSSSGKSAEEEGGYTVSKIVIFNSEGDLLGIAEDYSSGGKWTTISTLLYLPQNENIIQIACCLESLGSSHFKNITIERIKGPFFNIID